MGSGQSTRSPGQVVAGGPSERAARSVGPPIATGARAEGARCRDQGIDPLDEVRSWPPADHSWCNSSHLQREILVWIILQLSSRDMMQQVHALWAVRNLTLAETIDERQAKMSMVEAGVLAPLRDIVRTTDDLDVLELAAVTLEGITSVLTPRSRRAILDDRSRWSPESPRSPSRLTQETTLREPPHRDGNGAPFMRRPGSRRQRKSSGELMQADRRSADAAQLRGFDVAAAGGGPWR